MKDSCYLVLDASGIVSMTKRPPALKSGQHAVKVVTNVADKYFERAIPVAALTITDKHIISPAIDVSLEPATV